MRFYNTAVYLIYTFGAGWIFPLKISFDQIGQVFATP